MSREVRLRPIPSFDPEFYTRTNNLPFPNHTPLLEERYRNSIRNPIRNPIRSGYQRLPQTDIEETSFSNLENNSTTTTTEGEFVNPVDQGVFEIAEPASVVGGVTGGIATGATLIGGSTSVLGTGGSIATGVLAGTAVAGAGVVAKKLYDRTQEKGLTLPGSEFIGPGNPIPIGAAKNPTEQIAKDHDVAYSIAQHVDDIKEADRKAIVEFGNEYKKSGDTYAKIGELGISAKENIENIIGVQYPRNLGE